MKTFKRYIETIDSLPARFAFYGKKLVQWYSKGRKLVVNPTSFRIKVEANSLDEAKEAIFNAANKGVTLSQERSVSLIGNIMEYKPGSSQIIAEYPFEYIGQKEGISL